MKRGPSKGQRKDSSVKKESPKAGPATPLFRKRAFSTVNNNTLPIPNTLAYPPYNHSPYQHHPQQPLPAQQLQQQQQQQPQFRPMVPPRQQDRLPSIDFLTMSQPWHQRPHYNFHQPPAPHAHHPATPGQDEHLRSGHSSRSNSVPSYLPSEVAEKKLYPEPEERMGPPVSPSMSPLTTAGGPPLPSPPKDGWEDRQVDSYYQIIHPTLPILPSSKIRLRSFLAACPNETLRTAVICGLNGLAKKMSDPGAAISEHKPQLLRAVCEVAQSSGGQVCEDLPDEARPLYLVCLIFLFLYTDDGMWLSAAVSIAYSMGLHTVSQAVSEETGSRRMFLVLVILDCLNSAVKNVPSFIPVSMINFDEDRDALCFGSRTGVEMLKLCLALRNVSKGKTQEANCSPTISEYVARQYIELEAVKRQIEGMWDTVPILKALYLFVLINLGTLELGKVTDDSVPCAAKQMANLTELSSLMVSPLISVSPLMGFFYQAICEGACQVVEVLGIASPPPGHASVLREQALKLLEYLQVSGTASSCLVAVRPAMVRKIDRLVRAAAVHDVVVTPAASVPVVLPVSSAAAAAASGYTGARSPSSMSSGSTAASSNGSTTGGMAGYKYEADVSPHTKPGLRGIMMTSNSGLDRLANVAEKVKLLI